MDNSLVKRFDSLKSKKESLEKQVTQEEASFNTLKDQYKKDLTEFCTKYKVKSLDEAKALLATQEAELNKQIANAEQVLKVFDTQSSDTSINLDI